MKLLAAAIVILFGAGTLAQQSATRVDVSKLGPQVGQQVPDFNLRDQNGQTQTLQTIIGPKGAMLVFIRSADW
jgi:cytochrome oxidase Cu insertion factor (SCO1/SenC/PrrC family)